MDDMLLLKGCDEKAADNIHAYTAYQSINITHLCHSDILLQHSG